MIRVKNAFISPRLTLLLATVFMPCLLIRADLVGPYTPDTNTLFLLHFNESAGGSVTANVGIKGGNFYTVTNTTSGNGLAEPPPVTTLLGYPSYSGFGNAVSGTNIDGQADGVIGYDGNNSGAYDADVQGGPASPDAIAMTNLNIGNGGQTPFTLEAIICPSTITASQNQEIICSDDYNGSRGFQFKITTGGQLQFQFINPSGLSLSPSIPTTGPNAFVPNTWYHIAVTYDGTMVRLYWTKLDPSINADNLIGSANWSVGTGYGAVVAPLDIGAENRGSAQECFRGLIDEVRISNVARADNQMQFYSPTVTISVDPASQNIDDSQPVTFDTYASSTTPLGYQWRFNLIPIPDATNTSYFIPSVTSTNAGNYDVVVTNISGNSATSHVATLVVGAANFLAHRYSFTTDDTDSIGGDNGTNYGDATVSGGKLVLDGTTGTYMGLPGGMFHGLQAATFDFWASYGTISGDNEHVFDFGNTNGVALGVPGQPNNYLYFSPHSGTTHRLTGTGSTSEFEQTASANGVLDGQTVHITCVVDPPDGYIAIYTNGVLEALNNTNFTIPFSSLDDRLAYVGRSLFAELNGDAYLDASIDEFRIYAGALSAASVQQSEALGPDALLYDGPVQLVSGPSNITTVVSQPVTFSSEVIGHLPIIYQWYENNGAINGATNSTYSFVATAGQDGHTFQLMVTNNIGGTNYSAVSSIARLTLTTPESVTWLGVNGPNWDTTTLNWTNAAALVPFAQFDSAIFDSRGSGQPNVDLTEPISLTGLTVNSGADYLLMSSSRNGSIGGQAALIKQGTGKLTIDVPNTCTGGTLIQSGTLQIGNSGSFGAPNAGPITNDATLAFNLTNALTVTNDISGSGAVMDLGTGDLYLSGSNSYSGLTTIASVGTLHPRNAHALGTAGLVNTGGGKLYVDVNVDLLNPLTLGGGTALEKGGGGISTLGGAVTLASDTALSVDGGATLNLTNASGVNGSSANANVTLAGSGAGNISGPLTLGSGNLTVSGGTWTVAPANSYSGLTTINGGALLITGPLSLGQPPATFNASQVTLGGGALGAATNVTLNDGKIGILVNDNSSASGLTVNSNTTFTIANDIGGDASTFLTKTGPGTLVLGGTNDFAGTLNIDGNSTSANDGLTVIANNAAIANILAVPGTPFITIRNNNGGSSTLGLDGTQGGVTIAPDIGLAGRNVAVAAVENLAGDNTISGNFTLNVGGSYYIFQSDSGTLTLSATLPYATPNSGRTFTFQGNGDISVSGVIQNGSLDSTSASNVWINVVKDGSGLLNLSAINTYSGTTTVSNGVLSLTGSLNSIGGVTVAGGLLVGNGSITGPVTVQTGGAIEAGDTNAIGTLTLANTLTLSGNTLVKINQSAGTSDLFSGQSSVTYGGTLTVMNLAGTLVQGDQFTLFSPSASAGNFASIVGSPGSGLHYSFTNGVLSVAAGSSIVDNPTNIVFGVSGNTLMLSWPSDHLGWILQAQTNSLGVGLSTNWVDVPGSDASTNANLTINPANPTVFYRLRHP